MNSVTTKNITWDKIDYKYDADKPKKHTTHFHNLNLHLYLDGSVSLMGLYNVSFTEINIAGIDF
jgi:hypothetical protein